jgi:hypothetical protein
VTKKANFFRVQLRQKGIKEERSCKSALFALFICITYYDPQYKSDQGSEAVRVLCNQGLEVMKSVKSVVDWVLELSLKRLEG